MDSTSAQNPKVADPAPVETGGAFKRGFNRIFSRHVMSMAVLIALPVMFTTSFSLMRQFLQDPDIWWHLADARILCTTHHFMHTVPNSFTVAGEPWVNPEWLSELPFWFGYQALGLRGIYLVGLLVISGNILFFYWRGCWRSGHAGAAFWAAALGFLMISVNAGPRTIAIAYLAMSSELTILEAVERGKTRLLWLLPPLFCVWVNLHGSWLIGIGLLVLYIICGSFRFNKGVFEQEGFSVPLRNRLFAVLGVSLAVLMINPYGWRLVWNPIDMMLNQKLNIANVSEWFPLNLSSFAGACAAGVICLMVITNALAGRKWRVYELAFTFFVWYAALDHMRFLFMAAVITTPIIAVDIRRAFAFDSDSKTIPAMNALMAAGALTLIAYLFPPEAALQKKLGTMFPLESIESIQPTWRTFNVDNLGGMMAFQSKPSFIDSRFDTFEHHGVFQSYLRTVFVQAPLEVFDQYRIDHVILTENTPVAYLLARTPGWKAIKRESSADGFYVIYARNPASGAGTTTFLSAPAQR
jgi:hypothetical protein